MNVVAQQMTALFPTAQHIRRDVFTGVVDGLAIASASAFGD
jgi:hypothetical protein